MILETHAFMTKILDGLIALLVHIFKRDKLDSEIKYSVSIAQFKNKLISTVRSMGNSIYNIHDIIGVRYLTKLRLQFSALKEHKFRHNFDCLSPFCICGTAKEDKEHFLLHCPLYDI